MRTRSSLALLLALGTTLAACGGSGATPTAVPSAAVVVATPAATPTTAPSASDVPTAAPTGTPTPAPSDAASPSGAASASADLVPATASDPGAAGKGIIVGLPADWLVVSGPDVASESAITAWLAAHPAVSESSFRSIAKSMTDGKVALMAFDAANKSDTFTPNLNITFVDAPAGDMTAYLADQATQIKKAYNLDAAFDYQSYSPTGGMAGFLGDYTWTYQENPLAGLQLILPMDTRLAVLTFTALANQTGHYGTVLEPVFSTVKQQ